jgi:hypothetical protein
MLFLGAAFSLWLLFVHEWPYSPYPQYLPPINPAPEAIESKPGNALAPASPVEANELPAPMSDSNSAQDTEGAGQ